MSIADEIDRLAAQRDAGHLTEAEFQAAKARLFTQPPPGVAPDVAAINNLRRSLSDRWLGGVCGGLAKMTGIESWIVRLLFVIGILFAGFGFIPYVLLWIFVPPER
jgi:phage shock protein PspC (stress-responsive transcriptional regulator)